jgi:hypothetical protein
MLLALLLFAAPRFYPDDPVWKEPPPRAVAKVKEQKLNALVDFYKNTTHKKGQRNTAKTVYPSQGVNTLNELPDSTWYTNRHGRDHRLSIAALRRGPNAGDAPDMSGDLTIVSAKAEGVTPGFSVKDEKGRMFFLKFDPPSNPEMATASDVVCAKFFHAIGYNVPENYIIRFRPERLQIKKGVEFTDPFGRFRLLQPRDVKDLLNLVARDKDGSIRAVASYRIPAEPVGGFKYYKRRPDDPNEIAPHEHMRVLRGLYVFAAWLNHTDAKSLNTFDGIVEEGGRKFVRHYLVDFGSALGSDALFAKDPRLGHEYMLDPKPGLRELFSLGFHVPRYARVNYSDDPAVGRFSSHAFDPNRWKPNYPNAAFESRLPGDEYWGAKKVLAFTDEEIGAMVKTGQYSNPKSAEEIAKVLIERRNKIGDAFLRKVLPLENFRVEGDTLKFDDLAVKYGIRAEVPYTTEWARFNNESGALTPMSGPAEIASAPRGSYWAAIVRNKERNQSVTVYLRREDAWKVVGIEREGANRWEPR